MAISNHHVALIAVFACVWQVIFNFLFFIPSCWIDSRKESTEWSPADAVVVGVSSSRLKLSNSTIHLKRQQQQRQQPSPQKLPVELPKQPPLLERYYDVCVVGAGLSGAVIAERYANIRSAKVLVIERRDHIGGNCYDYVDKETGIRVSKYGAHLFHTFNRLVENYVQQFSKWQRYEHQVQAFIRGHHVPVPVNIDTVNALFDLNISSSIEMDEWLNKEQVHYQSREPADSEEMALSRVGPRLYELIFRPYTIKQWGKEPKHLGPEVTARIPVRNNRDPRYFSDPFQALPTEGYTPIFEDMLDNSLITTVLQTDYFDVQDKLNCGKLYYTGHIDRFFADLGWKKLEYRSLDFERRVLFNVTTTYFQPRGVINHPNASVPFTRIVEYKHFLNQPSRHTILFYEYSNDSGEPYYPVPNPENKALYAKYQRMADKETSVRFVGRLANYKYFNMDQSIENALSLFEKETLTTDLIVHFCDQDISWITNWQSRIRFSKIYLYQTCETPPTIQEEPWNKSATVTKLPKSAKDGSVWIHHMLRTDIALGGSNIFVHGQPTTTLVQLVDIMEGLRHAVSMIHFADLSRHPSRIWSRRCWKLNPVCDGKHGSLMKGLCRFHQTYASTGRSCRQGVSTMDGEFYVTAEAIRRNVVARRQLFETLRKELLENDTRALEQNYFLESCWGEILNSYG